MKPIMPSFTATVVDDFASEFFGDGEVAFFVAEMFVSGLEMERDGVMDAGFDAVVGEELSELVSALSASDEEVVSGFGVGSFVQELSLRKLE